MCKPFAEVTADSIARSAFPLSRLDLETSTDSFFMKGNSTSEEKSCMLLKVVSSFLALSMIISISLVHAGGVQSAVDAPVAVDWSGTVNCTVTGSRLQKTSGVNDTSDASARSRQSISSGDGFAEFTATETNKLRFCGLTNSPIGTDYVDIDFAIKLTDFGVAEVRENNLYKAETPYRTGDVFRITVDGGVVRYSKNGLGFHVSSNAPGYPLVVQAAFISLGGSIENTLLGAGLMRDTADWSTYQHDSAHTGYCIESNLQAVQLSKLKENWRFDTGGMVTGTPIVSGGSVYVGSWDGFMYALRESTGELLWKFNAGTIRVDPCDSTFGIDNTAALSEGKLFFAGANCDLYALNPTTGSVIWKTQLADPLNAFHPFSSPVVFDGKLYIGLASHCVNPCVRGRKCASTYPPGESCGVSSRPLRTAPEVGFGLRPRSTASGDWSISGPETFAQAMTPIRAPLSL
jgi:hypothetical protein